MKEKDRLGLGEAEINEAMASADFVALFKTASINFYETHYTSLNRAVARIQRQLYSSGDQVLQFLPTIHAD
jgi:hypothetical protein